MPSAISSRLRSSNLSLANFRNIRPRTTCLYSDGSKPTDSFVEHFVSKVISNIPPAFVIVNSFKYNEIFYEVPLPSSVQMNIAESEKIKHEAELESEARKKINEYLLQQKKDLVDNFIDSTVCNMRQYVKEICENVLGALNQRAYDENISKSTVNKIRTMIEKVHTLNFYDDKKIVELLNGLEIEVNKYKGQTNNGIIAGKLEEIVKASSGDYFEEEFNPTIDCLEIM